MTIYVETPRLLLRQWQNKDIPEFVEMNGDRRVMEYFPNVLTPQESENSILRYSNSIDTKGFGFWAAELKNEKRFIGFIGLNQIDGNHPAAAEIEIGWRLLPKYWRQGLASEGALGSLSYASNELKISRIVSQTPITNIASQGVMKKVGMYDTHKNFKHPSIAPDHPLAEHVLYQIDL